MRKSIQALSLILVSWAFLGMGSAHALIVGGDAVGAPGSETEVGSKVIIVDGSGFTYTAIDYYIPLDTPTTGTYGVTPITCGSGAAGTAGTCYDFGRGTGYLDTSALAMNIFFDMSSVTTSVVSAELSFLFQDLDLTPFNDPDNFLESVSLSYWKYQGPGVDDFEASPTPVVGPIFAEGALPDVNAEENLITWNLGFLALADLNASVAGADGFWIQLGFGSLYDVPCSEPSFASYSYKSSNDCNDLKNTSEQLAVKLTYEVSEVPVPAAVWLFGSALIGFIGFARRTTV